MLFLLILLLALCEHVRAFSPAIQLDNALQSSDLYTHHNQIRLAALTHHIQPYQTQDIYLPSQLALFKLHNITASWHFNLDPVSHEHYYHLKQTYMMHVKAPITPQKVEMWTKLLQQHNATILSYMPHNTYHIGVDSSVSCDPSLIDTINALRTVNGVIDVMHYEPQHKLHAKLTQIMYAADSQQHASILRGKHYDQHAQHHTLRLHMIPFMMDAQLSTLAERWQTILRSRKLDVSVYQSSSKYIDVVVHGAHLIETLLYLAHRAHIHHIEPKTKFVLQNKFATSVTQSDQPDVRDIFSHGIMGQDQIVTVSDTGVDSTLR